MFDVMIIGGGPAGMTAALYALRNGKSAVILEKQGFGGQITFSPLVENYPGTLRMSGNEFAEAFLEQILSHGAEVELENVISLKKENGYFVAETEDGNSFSGKTCILATGVRHRMLGLPGEEDLVGGGISFCAVCDGDFYSGQNVAIIGGGNSALQEALLLADKCSRVTVLQNLPAFTGEATLGEALLAKPNTEAFFNTVVESFETEGSVLKAVRTRNTETGETGRIPCDGVFEAIGLIPENDAFAELTVLDERGYFASGEDCLTPTPGLFVAGDCRSKAVRQLTTAAADGSAAALAACTYLNNL